MTQPTLTATTWDTTQAVPTAQFLLNRVPHQPVGTGWQTFCPAHSDQKASLSISVGADDRVLLHCHAGCALAEVLQGLRLAATDLFPDRDGRRLEAIYDYEDGERAFVRQVLRYAPKTFKQRRPDGAGDWIWSTAGVPDTLYRQPRLTHHAHVFLVEGEKDADRLWALDIPATTNAGGAGKWREAHTQQLVAAGVTAITILPDHDEAGRRHATTVADSCQRAGLAVGVLELPGLPEKGDVSDWLAAGHPVEDLTALADAAPLWQPTAEAQPAAASDELALTPLATLLAEPEEDQRWLVEGLIPAGGLALLVGKPKAGKTVTAQVLTYAVARGEPFLGRVTQQGPVYYLALEEKRSEFKRRFQAMGATVEPIFAVTAAIPKDGLRKLRRAMEQAKDAPVLIIIDPLLKFVRVKDANDYAEMTTALEPLLSLARECGATVLAIHHAGKTDRSGGDEVLGSSAIFGAVDVCLTQRRLLGPDGRPKYRTLSSIARYGEDLPETVLDRDPVTGLLDAAGSRADVDATATGRALLAALETASAPLTEPELLDRIEGDTGRKRGVLRKLWEANQVTRTGAGKKGSPYLYALPLGENAKGDADEQTRIVDSDPLLIANLSFSSSRPRRGSDENRENGQTPRQEGGNARLRTSDEHRETPDLPRRADENPEAA